MARYLLDTNVLSALVRDPHGALAARVAALPPEALCTSVIVAAELRYGAAKRGSHRLTRSVEAILGALDVLALEPPADEAYATLRAGLERDGRPTGANDLLIAAHAASLGCTLVTDDRAFERIPGLVVENWLR